MAKNLDSKLHFHLCKLRGADVLWSQFRSSSDGKLLQEVGALDTDSGNNI